MARYSIPPDIREREKIVGGIFTISQTLFLAIGILIFLACVSIVQKLTGKVLPAVVAGAVLGGVFVPFAFIKVKKCGNVELAQYLIYLFRYKKSRKEFPNVNEHYRK